MSAPGSALRQARVGLAARRRRALLTGLGIALAAAMLSAAVVISYGLGTGFSRGARAASLPDIIVRFNEQAADTVRRRVLALPDVARYALRLEVSNVGVFANGRARDDGVAEVLSNLGPHQGYALLAGRRLSARGQEVLVEKAFADSFGLRVGSVLNVEQLGPQRVVGLAEGPDDVGYPLGRPRFYLSRAAIDARFGHDADPGVNVAEVWLRNPAYIDEVLAQARATSFGLTQISFATRSGVRILLDQAAGIVIELLVALSVIALVTAGVLLGASARAEVQRRLGAIGVRRAIGETRGQVTLAQALEGLMVALPAGSLGVAAGTLTTAAPAGRLLTLLNEPPPGWALLGPVAAAWLAAVLLPTLGAAWPAWRASGGSIVRLLRGGDISGARRSGGGRRPRFSFRLPQGGLVLLGVRLVGARRARLGATALTLGLSAGFVLLMLALASAISTLETDPAALGKRFQLTAVLPATRVGAVRRIPGVQSAAPRYELTAADSFALGESIDVIAFPGDHTVFESPQLVSGRRLRGPGETEVGAGLANALGLSAGSTLAMQLPSGRELRLRVSGIVSSLTRDGRVAYVPAAALLRADPGAPYQLAVRLTPHGSLAAVTAGLNGVGAASVSAASAVAAGAPLIRVLRTILTTVAIVDGLVCLYALIQACALTVYERRRTLAVLRASGGGAGALARVLLGAVLVLVVPAATLGVVLERLAFGPALAHLAENYAVLDLTASWSLVAAVVAGLGVAALVAVAWVTREASRESVVEGLAG